MSNDDPSGYRLPAWVVTRLESDPGIPEGVGAHLLTTYATKVERGRWSGHHRSPRWLFSVSLLYASMIKTAHGNPFDWSAFWKRVAGEPDYGPAVAAVVELEDGFFSALRLLPLRPGCVFPEDEEGDPEDD